MWEWLAQNKNKKTIPLRITRFFTTGGRFSNIPYFLCKTKIIQRE
jgi:hypothetical protein